VLCRAQEVTGEGRELRERPLRGETSVTVAVLLVVAIVANSREQLYTVASKQLAVRSRKRAKRESPGVEC
jgi:hypothetical protein